MKTAVVLFPGSSGDRDVERAVSETLNTQVDMVWHEEKSFSNEPDLVILPGGYSFGGYLRGGAMAACSPIIEAVRKHANEGKMLLGISNGFQILTEAQLLPGALLTNSSLTFVCKKTYLRIEQTENMFTSSYKTGDIIEFPIAHHEGLYFLPAAELKELEEAGQVVFRYANKTTGKSGANYALDGSMNGIAGICNKKGNILGLMPHPERATFPHLNGGSDGVAFWKSIEKAFCERGGF